MANAFVIEVGEEAVGLVVREGRRYRFISSSRWAGSLDRKSFRTPKDAERAALGVLMARPHRAWPPNTPN